MVNHGEPVESHRFFRFFNFLMFFCFEFLLDFEWFDSDLYQFHHGFHHGLPLFLGFVSGCTKCGCNHSKWFKMEPGESIHSQVYTGWWWGELLAGGLTFLKDNIPQWLGRWLINEHMFQRGYYNHQAASVFVVFWRHEMGEQPLYSFNLKLFKLY